LPPKSKSQKRAVVLVGFMGAGKTTVGQRLSRLLKWRFIDLDDRIREREGREIAAIFRDSGEPYFRRVETESLRAVLPELEQEPGCILALGGGAFVRPENVSLLREFGAPVVFLDASIEVLRRRCLRAAAKRPLFRDENQFRQLYEARRESYMAADVRLDTSAKRPAQVARELALLLGLAGPR
jgi:shikimate kinase